MWRICAILALAVLTAGCAKDFNTTNTARYYDAGTRAEAARDFPGAEEYYGRALIWAGTEHVPAALLSLTMYNLGRMKGHACKFDEARELLLTSLALEESTSGPASAQVSRRLFELGRLYYDRRLYTESVPYYSQGVAMVRRLKLEDDEPVTFTEALQDYANALREAGDQRQADGLRSEITARRNQEVGARPRYLIARYSPTCRNGHMLVYSGRA
ncbi:tetratricopeptide repeat protein [Ferrovibrio sp.]|uniref:tetratricopeptide repeat protein n=1 Tax=Ferrovibrio sp. TaxID=1917215 RepID=UPI0025C16C72|nr:tetratricopeptide repeat protein [Ferrovibrio sp.]